VQDPEDAPYPDMPRNALANAPVDYRLAVSEMGPVLESLVAESIAPNGAAPRDLEMEVRIAESGYSNEKISEQLGELTPLSCPECGGPLWQQDAANTARYRCRVGHAYTAESMLSAEEEALEASLWAAVRLFDQRANVLTTMAEKDITANRARMAEHHRNLAEEARSHAKLLRGMIVNEPED
jgi:two-component system chemotaxis response regulator CheB